MDWDLQRCAFVTSTIIQQIPQLGLHRLHKILQPKQTTHSLKYPLSTSHYGGHETICFHTKTQTHLWTAPQHTQQTTRTVLSLVSSIEMRHQSTVYLKLADSSRHLHVVSYPPSFQRTRPHTNSPLQLFQIRCGMEDGILDAGTLSGLSILRKRVPCSCAIKSTPPMRSLLSCSIS